ncbi:DUF4175 family protein [Paracoccus sp. 1_MG-2023]|uniref:DUF4175 domain-containing protein n=1 Tax=unclassified Paracoccus (in: a-proteobacteria) TaxID=2688777 RepID=UPI001C089BEF|nr:MULTISPECIES: DUF4175 family protein [unclassified Paracoccus (in: a-proteobacteria)]MBU2957009.1 DUF4175 domain-containing protein [Paracoccus sp. C2R09]MDO6668206.1 DUF4175 family protein [Paracoccus sp. 1_MG-2023]
MALIRRIPARDRPGATRPRTTDEFIPDTRLQRALRLTRIGLVWERAITAFWPLACLLGIAFAAMWGGLVAAVPAGVLPWIGGVWLAATLAAAVHGGLRHRRVLAPEASDRLDRSLPGRPLAALNDRPAIGDAGPLWQAHLDQMRALAARARAVAPDADLSRRDPFALRLAALLALAMALIFGGAEQMGQGIRAMAATVLPRAALTETTPTGPEWEGWAEPPAYTRRPAIYLNALPEGEVLELPKGSRVSLRLYANDVPVAQDIAPGMTGEADQPELTADRSGTLGVGGREYAITVLPDAAPVIAAGDIPQRRADGRMVQGFSTQDDHGVAAAEARIDLDLPAVNRRFGLAVDPEPRDPVTLPLPLPRGDRQDVAGELTADLARHPWANLPVTLRLRALDGIGQEGLSAPRAMDLPGRRFFAPMAAALIELRRDLLWSRENARRSAEILRALTWQPEGFVEPDLYSELRGAVGLLEGDAFDADARDRLADALWEAAVLLEDGGLTDALQRMRDAQERLSEAIRNGASPDEIQRLMDELREATDAYTQMLAEQAQPEDMTDTPDRGDRQDAQITGDQLQQMMDEIQRLMNEGRMAEAQQMLEQFNRLMENIEVRQQQGQQEGEGRQGSQSMNRLADTLRDQQELSDEAFGQMQQGQGGSSDLADRQRDLREELGRQRELMPGEGSENGDEARRRLDEAGRAMEEAEQALRDGDPSGAIRRQADAINSMREGMRSMADMLAQEGQAGQPGLPEDGQGEGQEGQGQASRGQQGSDPLGREPGNSGGVAQGGDVALDQEDRRQRARELLDEIRRRSADDKRPTEERDYLGRLLDRF